MLDGHHLSTETLDFDVASVSLKGARDYQEDSLVSCFPIGQDTGFAVLADGMGGHTSGHVASALVVAETFSKLKVSRLHMEDGLLDIPTTLHDAAQAANARVAAHVKDDDAAHGMGATLLSIVIRRDKLSWASVGDSPLMLYRDGALRQLNKDHSMATQIDMMVKIGAMSAEVGAGHPDRNTLTSAILGLPIAEIDCPAEPVTLLPDDVLIIASDGLQYLSDEKIVETLERTQDGQGADMANALMDALVTLDHPGQDNASFIVIKLGAAQAAVSKVVHHAAESVLANASR